jgi:hypothetical protein
MQNLLNVMGESIRKTGQNKWRMRCPVHDGKDFNVSVKQMDDGSVSAQCYVCGANGLDIYKHLGLPLGELFNNYNYTPEDKPKYSQETIMEDKIVVKLYEQAKHIGEKVGYSDEKRYRLAASRLGII